MLADQVDDGEEEPLCLSVFVCHLLDVRPGPPGPTLTLVWLRDLF